MRAFCLLAPLATLVLAAAPTSSEMSLSTPDGFTLKGTLTLPEGKGKAPVVILAHQFRSDREAWAPLVAQLTARGIGALALDLRGHGASTLKDGSDVRVSEDFKASAQAVGFDRIPADLAQAATWLRAQPGVDGQRLGLAGASVGALSALMAGPDVHPVAILALSPAGTSAFGEGAADRLQARVRQGQATVLVLAAEGDKGAAENAQLLKGLPGVSVQFSEGDAHGTAFLPARADLMAIFFGEYLTYHKARKAGAKPVPAK
jgi:dienelactone hydrolase